LGDDRRGEPAGPNAFADVDGDGRVDTILIPKCSWQASESGQFEWVCTDTGYGVMSGISVYNEPERGAVYMAGGWAQLPNQKTAVVPALSAGTLASDFNGDGYSDLAVGTGTLGTTGNITPVNGMICLSKGDGQGDCRVLPKTGMVNGVDRSYLPLTVASDRRYMGYGLYERHPGLSVMSCRDRYRRQQRRLAAAPALRSVEWSDLLHHGATFDL
jgi:hypothetical protein